MKNFQLIYSRSFVDDLIDAIEYIKKDSAQAAKSFERNVHKKIRQLKDFPEIGHKTEFPELEGIRILVIGNFLALYEVDNMKQIVYLHAFCHGARDYPNIYKYLFRK